MALQKTLSIIPLALTVVDSYIKINEVHVSVARGVNIRYDVYSSAAGSADPEVYAVATMGNQFPFPEDQVMSGTNSIEWAYNQLKTLPEFADAINV